MPPVHHRSPELLAPAGGEEALRAAIGAGADAVYLGLEEFNARRGAANFTLETLGEVCRFVHLRGAKVYLTMNVVILPHEMQSALAMVDSAWAAGVDAVIVQDLGLAKLLREMLPDVRVHASTQMDVHNRDSIRVLARAGVSRVTLAREVSVEEISELADEGARVGVEVESFVHGALCVSYSGQCLFSSMVGGRSANRGMCAQPCRLAYDLVADEGGPLTEVGAHLLSPKDLAGITILPRLLDAGVSALKIEGRMKSPEYVALVTGVYRGAVDRAAAAPETFEVREGEMSVLSEAFSRGFSEAYLIGERGNEMMSYRRPNNRGVLVGRVSTAEGGRARIVFDALVDSGDTLEFWTARGRFAQPAGGFDYQGSTRDTVPAGTQAWISVAEPVGPGDRVFRVRNAALEAAARRTFADAEKPSKPLAFEVSVTVGRPLAIKVTDETGRSGRFEGDAVEPARTKPVTADEVMEHVGRLGGTPYVVRDWSLELSPGAGIGFSTLHRARREALENYEQAVLQPWSGRHARLPALPVLPATKPTGERPLLVAEVSSLEAARECLSAGADEVHVPSWAFQEVEPGVVPLVPRVLHDCGAAPHLEAAIAAGRCVCGNLGALGRLAEQGVKVQAHWSLNALNSFSVAQLAEMGAASVWLSPELSARQIESIASAAAVPVGVAVAGRQEIMVLEHCVLMAEGPCAQRCESCVRRRSPRYLLDRKGYRFPVITDPEGRSHVYNSVPLDVTASLPELLELPLAGLRLDLQSESPARAGQEVTRVRAALTSALAGRSVPKPTGAKTSGHYFRGVS